MRCGLEFEFDSEAMIGQAASKKAWALLPISASSAFEH